MPLIYYRSKPYKLTFFKRIYCISAVYVKLKETCIFKSDNKRVQDCLMGRLHSIKNICKHISRNISVRNVDEHPLS